MRRPYSGIMGTMLCLLLGLVGGGFAIGVAAFGQGLLAHAVHNGLDAGFVAHLGGVLLDAGGLGHVTHALHQQGHQQDGGHTTQLDRKPCLAGQPYAQAPDTQLFVESGHRVPVVVRLHKGRASPRGEGPTLLRSFTNYNPSNRADAGFYDT